MLQLNETQMYSIDYSEKFYRDNTVFSGHLGGLALELLPELKERHQFLLGDIACTWSNELKDCDFLILDTTHFLPGEVLDFITLLPSLKDGAVVVLHDIRLNQNRNKDAMATGVVISTSVGEKYINSDDTNFGYYPNIGAIVVNEDTRKNIINMFLALLLTWSYLPNDKQIVGYRKVIEELYDKDLVQIFDMALAVNKRKLKAAISARWPFPFAKVRPGAKIVLFGAGRVGTAYKSQIDNSKYCNVVKWVDSLYQSMKIEGVVCPDTINEEEYDLVVIATVKEKYALEIKASLLDMGVENEKIIWEGKSSK